MRRFPAVPAASPRLLITLAMFFVFCAATATISAAQTFTTLTAFDGTNGFQPFDALMQGSDGSYYSTTQLGGDLVNCPPSGCGTVFKMTPSGTVTVLFSFSGSNGEAPTGLVRGNDGNFYGTTFCSSQQDRHGRTLKRGPVQFCHPPGSFFRVSPSGNMTTLHEFSPTEGAAVREVILGNDGNFYGTAETGGTHNAGTVFKVTPGGAVTILHTFSGPDGNGPYSALIQGVDGNLYGTTSGGGAAGINGHGTIFKISPRGTFTLLHIFTGSDGAWPLGGMVQATDGNFYGTTSAGGTNTGCLNQTCGTVFKITPDGNFAMLYNFAGPDGAEPHGALMQATDGNFYGTTGAGGPAGAGTVFRITPAGTLTTLHSFCSENGCTDGAVPFAGLIQGADGLLYGTASGGGDPNCNPPAGCGSVFSVSAVTPTANQFVPVTPCRLADTRSGNGPIQGGAFAFFDVRRLSQTNGCGDLSSATSYSINVTLIPQNGAPVSYLTVWPAGRTQPLVSTMNSLDGRTKANAAIVPAGASGAVSVFVTNSANVVIDIDGYFAPPSAQTLQFYPLPPCRVADTRKDTFPQGLGAPHLSQGVARDFPVLSAASCNIPPGAQAYSLNFTAIPYPSLGHPLAYLEVWPTGEQPQHPVSTLNNPTATYVANAAIVPTGTDGKITSFASDDTDLVIDINGYFAAPGSGGLSLYPAVPCRVFDSRKVGNGQPFGGALTPPVDVVDSPCGIPNTAQAYVFNATVVPSGYLSYLTLWPDSEGQPAVSTLNAADGWITSNMAIVLNVNGSIDAYAAGMTQLILDISSYFAP